MCARLVICRSRLGQLKISTITTAVFKLQYQYQYVFYENTIFLHTDCEDCILGGYKDIYS